MLAVVLNPSQILQQQITEFTTNANNRSIFTSGHLHSSTEEPATNQPPVADQAHIADESPVAEQPPVVDQPSTSMPPVADQPHVTDKPSVSIPPTTDQPLSEPHSSPSISTESMYRENHGLGPLNTSYPNSHERFNFTAEIAHVRQQTLRDMDNRAHSLMADIRGAQAQLVATVADIHRGNMQLPNAPASETIPEIEISPPYDDDAPVPEATVEASIRPSAGRPAYIRVPINRADMEDINTLVSSLAMPISPSRITAFLPPTRSLPPPLSRLPQLLRRLLLSRRGTVLSVDRLRLQQLHTQIVESLHTVALIVPQLSASLSTLPS